VEQDAGKDDEAGRWDRDRKKKIIKNRTLKTGHIGPVRVKKVLIL
jgi:hypothetical protein